MIVTGAARGIGRSVAIRAAAEGAEVAVVDRLQEGASVSAEINRSGGSAIFIKADVSVESEAERMVSETISGFGKLDIAINNAGVMGNPNVLHLLDRKDMDYTFANNFYSVYFCSKYELARFIEQGRGGSIVNNASIAGLTGLPGNPAYNASKHAVNGLTKNMALDYAGYGIRVNSVNPAGTDTAMVEEARIFVMNRMKEAEASGAEPEHAGSMAGRKTETMQNRNATADEQAASILYLASDDASHITGCTMATDGGWTAF